MGIEPRAEDHLIKDIQARARMEAVDFEGLEEEIEANAEAFANYVIRQLPASVKVSRSRNSDLAGGVQLDVGSPLTRGSKNSTAS
jgi:hypothetical protein